MTVIIKVTGKSGLTKQAIPRALALWESQIAPEILAEMKRRAPVSMEPGGGRLRDSLKYERRNTGRGVEARFLSNVSYAKFVDEGTKPHRIEPREARVLHWSSGASDVFARSVNHPGTRANPFIQRAIDSLMPWVKQQMKDDVMKGLKP